MKKLASTLLVWLFGASFAVAATLLPPGEQQFFDLNGNPLSGGSVEFFIPGTSTHKTTWSNSTQTSPNPNPVPLGTGGFVIIYGSGTYRMLVKDAQGNVIYDQLTADTSTAGGLSFAGTSTGTANAQLVPGASSFTLTDGQVVNFRAGFTNTGAMTLNANNTGALAVVKDTLSGPVPLSGGEIVGTNVVSALYDAVLGEFHLVNSVPSGFGATTTVAAATTTTIGNAPGNVVSVTGTGVIINSFGSAGSLNSPIYMVTFSAGNVIANTGSTIITPNGANISTSANDFAIMKYRGGSNWTILQYVPGSVPVSTSVFTSGSGTFDAQFFKTLEVTLVGGGGGGGAQATNNGSGGGTTTFGAIGAGGGAGGIAGSSNGGTGGVGGSGGSGSCGLRVSGSAGMGAATNFTGGGIGSPPNIAGNGGSSPFGGAGRTSNLNDHLAASTNSGSGGAGAATIGPGTGGGGGGGGAGEFVRDCLIAVSASTYSWTVGAGGAGGAAGGVSGGAGGSGAIIVRAYR